MTIAKHPSIINLKKEILKVATFSLFAKYIDTSNIIDIKEYKDQMDTLATQIDTTTGELIEYKERPEWMNYCSDLTWTKR